MSKDLIKEHMSYNMQSGIDKVCSDIAGFLRYKYRLISIEYKGQNFIIGGEINTNKNNVITIFKI